VSVIEGATSGRGVREAWWVPTRRPNQTGAQPHSSMTLVANSLCAQQEADSLFIFKLVLFSAGAGAALKFGSVGSHLPAVPPSLPLGLAVVAAATLAATSPWCAPDG
jgi:hypothetical protein